MPINKQPNRKIDMTGTRCDHLLVVREHPVRGANGMMRWECLCDCGNTCVVLGLHLRAGSIRSCGCLRGEMAARRREHVGARSSWANMMQRCYNENNTYYHNYGGRGIRVVRRWHTFANFLADMGDRPKGLTLERVENDKGYSPTNCEWATRKVQANNTRRTQNCWADVWADQQIN